MCFWLAAYSLVAARRAAYGLWSLRTRPRFATSPIIQVTFTTPPGQGTQTYASYDGKIVELTGEVQSVLNGNARAEQDTHHRNSRFADTSYCKFADRKPDIESVGFFRKTWRPCRV